MVDVDVLCWSSRLCRRSQEKINSVRSRYARTPPYLPRSEVTSEDQLSNKIIVLTDMAK